MAKKDINICTSLVGKGLEREYLILKELLNRHDVYTVAFHYTNIAGAVFTRADICIYLEVILPNMLCLSRENWYIPNSEWHHGINDQYLPRMTKILCKTRDCERIWKQKLSNDRPERVEYLGFESRDLYDESVPREERFLHCAGESEFKNTEAVVTAWKTAVWPTKPLPLTVVSRQPKYRELLQDVDPETITVVSRASEDELRHLMNSHRYHVLPSAYEGYGHLIHEGISCGALMITTKAAPMNEFAGIQQDWAVPICGVSNRSLAQLKQVSPIAVATSCVRAASAHEGDKVGRSMAARKAFLSDREEFRNNLLRLVGV